MKKGGSTAALFHAFIILVGDYAYTSSPATNQDVRPCNFVTMVYSVP